MNGSILKGVEDYRPVAAGYDRLHGFSLTFMCTLLYILGTPYSVLRDVFPRRGEGATPLGGAKTLGG